METLMANVCVMAQPIRLQHLHQYTSRILLLTNRELKQTTTAMATRTPQNKRLICSRETSKTKPGQYFALFQMKITNFTYPPSAITA